MKTSIRLLLSALLVSAMTYAAVGAPMPKDGQMDRKNTGGGHSAHIETPAPHFR